MEDGMSRNSTSKNEPFSELVLAMVVFNGYRIFVIYK